MLEQQECINKLADFKSKFAQEFGITKLGIFGSVARKDLSFYHLSFTYFFLEKLAKFKLSF